MGVSSWGWEVGHGECPPFVEASDLHSCDRPQQRRPPVVHTIPFSEYAQLVGWDLSPGKENNGQQNGWHGQMILLRRVGMGRSWCACGRKD